MPRICNVSVMRYYCICIVLCWGSYVVGSATKLYLFTLTSIRKFPLNGLTLRRPYKFNPSVGSGHVSRELVSDVFD